MGLSLRVVRKLMGMAGDLFVVVLVYVYCVTVSLYSFALSQQCSCV
jgi:hypothetical protein